MLRTKKTKDRVKKPMSLSRARAIVQRYSGSLLPSLGGATILNAVAMSFFSPGLSLSEAFKGAGQIDEALRIVKAFERKNKEKKKRKEKTSAKSKGARQAR
jgi:hypothetical protein